MNYFIHDKAIFYENEAGAPISVDYNSFLVLGNPQDDFRQTNYYKDIVSSISEAIKWSKKNDEPDTIILSAPFFYQPGLVQSLEEGIAGIKIKTDLDFVIELQNLTSGEYSLIDIWKDKTYVCNFSIEHDGYTITRKELIDNSSLKEILKTNFADFSKEERLADCLFEILFNYSTAVKVNTLIENDEISEKNCHLFTLFETELGGYLNTTFSNFFDILSDSVFTFIKEYITIHKNIYIKSPLIAYKLLKSPHITNERIKFVCDMDLLSSKGTRKNKKANFSYELNGYRTSVVIKFPFSSWMLSEIDNMSLELLKVSPTNKQPLRIDLLELEDSLKENCFLINDKKLVKYLIEFQLDGYDNLNFKIETIDKKFFFHQVKTYQND